MATIGLDKLYYAKITEDADGNETYETPQQMAKAMTAEGTDYDSLTYSLELTSEEYGIGFRKGSALTADVNKAIDELVADGTLPALAEKYALNLAF